MSSTLSSSRGVRGPQTNGSGPESQVPLGRGPSRRRTTGLTVGRVGLLLVVQAFLVAAFVFPGHEPKPHNVPVGVVGPPALADTIEGERPGAFDVTSYRSESEAARAIEERDVYGALVVDGGGRQLLTASAASASVSRLLNSAFANDAEQVEVRDLKPLDEDDPSGATINLLFLPLVMVCLSAVFALSSLRLSAPGMLGAVALFAGAGGLAAAGIVGAWLGALPGSYLELSGMTALIILSIATVVAGLERLLGKAGIGLGALLFLVIGNPASGNGSAPEMLPGVWRSISQYLPNGAGGTGLRNTAYFDGNAIGRPLIVLAAYALVGVLLVVAGEAVRRRRTKELETV